MSDYNSSLPIRTETDGDAVVKLVDTGGSNIAGVNASNEQLVKDTDVETGLSAIETNQTDKSQLTQITDGTDELAINSDGSVNVNVVDASVGDDINVFGTSVAGVPNTPTTVIDYTVNVGKTLKLKSVLASGSGKIKVEVKAGTASSETLRSVVFTSTANPNGLIEFPTPLEVSASDKVLVILTNKDTVNQDLYANISGEEV